MASIVTRSPANPAFASVLLATDFTPASGAAFRTAVDLCRLLGSRLTLLHVFEYADAGTYPESAQPTSAQPASSAPPGLPGRMQDARSHLHNLRRDAINAGLQCETSMPGGFPSDTIQEFIRAQHIDLVVMGTSALHGFERLVFGSTAEALMRSSPVPVLIVGPHAEPGAVANGDRPVVFATDFNHHTIGALSLAAVVAAATRSPLHCLHVLPRSLENETGARALPEILVNALQHIAAASAVADSAPVPTPVRTPVCATVFASQVSSAVVEYAAAQRARLIVLGVRRASLASTHTPAHIAYRIVTEATCPVLTMTFDTCAESDPVAATAARPTVA